MSENQLHLKEVDHDSIEDIDPNSLMEGVSKSRLGKTMIVSIIFHIIFIMALSVGFLGECVHYGTIDVKKAKKVEAEQKKKDEEEKKKQELLAKAKEDAKKAAAIKKEIEKNPPKAAEAKVGKEGDGKHVPNVIKEINETSNERPKESSIKSLDDDFDL